MITNKVYIGDCFKLIKDLSDNSIDLLITSPPYADVKSYGKKVNVLHPDKYVDWLIKIMPDVYRVLKPSGSFILNINDKCHKKQRHIYVFDLIVRTVKETNLKLYDRYFWYKTEGTLPNGGPKRLNNITEYLLHFCKDPNKIKWNMDNVREKYSEATLKRFKSPMQKYGVDEKTGEKILLDTSIWSLNKKGKPPSNLLNFKTNHKNKYWGNTGKIKHPAPFSPDLPTWFIKALTDPNDVVLDIFIGSGTTAVAAIKLNRQWIGFELNNDYAEDAMERIDNIMLKNDFFGDKNG